MLSCDNNMMLSHSLSCSLSLSLSLDSMAHRLRLGPSRLLDTVNRCNEYLRSVFLCSRIGCVGEKPSKAHTHTHMHPEEVVNTPKHRCPFWLVCPKNRRPWLRPSIFQQGHFVFTVFTALTACGRIQSARFELRLVLSLFQKFGQPPGSKDVGMERFGSLVLFRLPLLFGGGWLVSL